MDYGALPQPTRVGSMNNVEGSIAVLNQGTVDSTGTVIKNFSFGRGF
jgi:hypothetical protein